jgi:anionic cell wall polymer biosynthesis LytR-Cps2A-Psr (LCP) family protein
MATAIVVMDRSDFGANTDVIVAADPAARTLIWVPRDLWCDRIGDRVNRAYALGGHDGLTATLASLGVTVAESVCLLPTAVEAGLAGVEIRVPVTDEMAFWYPLEPQLPIEEGRKVVRFSPPAETLSGERIHQWIGARYVVDGAGSDLRRIDRQQRLVESLLEERFDFGRFLADPSAVRLSSPRALDELAAVRVGWILETMRGFKDAEIDGKAVLVQARDHAG